jgi:hypothetical protein
MNSVHKWLRGTAPVAAAMGHEIMLRYRAALERMVAFIDRMVLEDLPAQEYAKLAQADAELDAARQAMLSKGLRIGGYAGDP